MFDGIMNAAKNSVPMMIMFFIAAIVMMVIWLLLSGGSFDPMAILKAGIAGAVAALTTSLVYGAAKG